MPLRKAAKLREMTTDELKKEEKELTNQLFKLRFQLATGQIEKPQKIRVVRKEVAKVKTLLRERELALHEEKKE
ncbi:MAG: 50S ribosomal protein L29 [Acidobacteriota bacterium]